MKHLPEKSFSECLSIKKKISLVSYENKNGLKRILAPRSRVHETLGIGLNEDLQNSENI
jgi:hypothetical protein